MSLISHKHYISSTEEDLERAAGFMKIKSCEDSANSEMFVGASAALYALAWNDLKDERDFYEVWKAIVNGWQSQGGEDD